MSPLTGLLLLVAALIVVGCAFVVGEGTATVVNRAETKREVTPDTPAIEDVLLQQADKKEKRK